MIVLDLDTDCVWWPLQIPAWPPVSPATASPAATLSAPAALGQPVRPSRGQHREVTSVWEHPNSSSSSLCIAQGSACLDTRFNSLGLCCPGATCTPVRGDTGAGRRCQPVSSSSSCIVWGSACLDASFVILGSCCPGAACTPVTAVHRSRGKMSFIHLQDILIWLNICTFNLLYCSIPSGVA